MTEIVKTKSFELAIYAKGDINANKLALVLPGRLDTKDYTHTTSLINLLAENGYQAVSFDPPGVWESPGGIELYTTTNYLKAVTELIDYFGNRPTLLVGFSRGGSVAMLSVDNPAVSGLVLLMANYGPPTPPLPSTLEAGYELVMQDVPPGITRVGDKKEFKLPLHYFLDGEKYVPGEALKNCMKPKLLIYGTTDRYTEPKEVTDLFSVIPEPKMIFEVNSAHNYRTEPTIINEVNNLVEKFLKDNNL